MLLVYFFIIGFTYAATLWPENDISINEPEINEEPEELKYNFLDEMKDYEIIYLPSNSLTDEFSLDLNVFGNKLNLKLYPNNNLVAQNFKIFVRDKYGDEELNFTVPNCHYLHRDNNFAAAISLCGARQAQGIFFLPNDTLEIQPLPLKMQPFLPDKLKKKSVPHLIRRSPFLPQSFADDISNINTSFLNNYERVKRNKKKLTIEAALFFDAAGYKLFAPYFDHNDKAMIDMLLAYMNAVQAIYHHPSLKQSIDIVLVKLEILKHQPKDLPHHSGERYELLRSFCAYNQKHNPTGDENPNHWDLGLYVSGLDFFTYENGTKNGITMGLAGIKGICREYHNCVIAELGTTNIFGKPYPSAGFTSVYVLAHEIGHSLGMHHDGVGNNCPMDGFIMSPSRGTNGETIWSTCSSEVASSLAAKCLLDKPLSPPKKLDHSKYENLPGQVWGAKKQCEILLRDKDAELHDPYLLKDICTNLHCKTPHRSGYYFAGPALEGTICNKKGTKWCEAGSCVKRKKKHFEHIALGGWSDWFPDGECTSHCIKKSKGYQTKRRTCTNPKPQNTIEICDGSATSVMLCNDEEICKNKRQSIEKYASSRCHKFSTLLSDLDKNALGLQAEYESDRIWMSCAIFCKRKNSKIYYTPRIELNDLNVDPYFPDGTWCHNDGKIDYYCLKHHCLPENTNLRKKINTNDDLEILQNAPAKIKPLSKKILNYFSIDSHKKPLSTKLKLKIKTPKENEWIDKDYIEIAEPKTHHSKHSNKKKKNKKQ